MTADRLESKVARFSAPQTRRNSDACGNSASGRRSGHGADGAARLASSPAARLETGPTLQAMTRPPTGGKATAITILGRECPFFTPIHAHQITIVGINGCDSGSGGGDRSPDAEAGWEKRTGYRASSGIGQVIAVRFCASRGERRDPLPPRRRTRRSSPRERWAMPLHRCRPTPAPRTRGAGR